MNPELQKSIAELINTLTHGAKGTGELMQSITPEAWRVAVRNVIIDGCTDILIGGCIGLVIILFSYFIIGQGVKNSKKFVKECEDTGNDYKMRDAKDNLIGWRTGYWLCMVVGFIAILCGICTAAPKVLNPGYQAGVNIIDLARSYR